MIWFLNRMVWHYRMVFLCMNRNRARIGSVFINFFVVLISTLTELCWVSLIKLTVIKWQDFCEKCCFFKKRIFKRKAVLMKCKLYKQGVDISKPLMIMRPCGLAVLGPQDDFGCEHMFKWSGKTLPGSFSWYKSLSRDTWADICNAKPVKNKELALLMLRGQGAVGHTLGLLWRLLQSGQRDGSSV